MKKGILIYNPISHGGKYAMPAAKSAVKLYKDYGTDLILYDIKPEIGGFEGLLQMIDEEHPDHIVIAGGDGTLCRYVEFAKKSGIELPIGIIPAGTANDYAGSVGVSSKIETSIQQILSGTFHPCDIALIRSETSSGYFINVFSSGFLTCVSHTTSDNLKKRFGRLAYFINGLKEVFSPKTHIMTVTCDTDSYSGKVLLILVLNGQTAGRMKFAKDADPSDGVLDIRIFTGKTLLGTVAVALKVFFGFNVHTTKDIVCLRGKQIKIQGDKHETDIDGDSGPSYPVEIECLAGALRVIR